jgi:TolA-binding protein
MGCVRTNIEKTKRKRKTKRKLRIRFTPRVYWDTVLTEMVRCWIATLLLLVLCALPSAQAAAPEEDQAFKAAIESFRLTYFERAEKELAEFVQKFPGSTNAPAAIFFQGEARLKQSNYAGAISLISSNLPAAGAWSDKYLYTLGHAQLGLKDFAKAAEAFGRVAREFPASTNRFDAAYEEAAARAKVQDWDAVIRLLQDTNGVFQTMVQSGKGDAAVFTRNFQGHLLLSEAKLAKKEYADAEHVLDRFKDSLLNQTNRWQRQHLICRIQLAAGRLEDALQSASNLVVIASNTLPVVPALQAESFAFEGEILERLGQADKALEAYTNNVAEGIPVSRQREALYKTVDLSIRQNRIAEAAQILERFLAQYPKTPSADLAWVGLGELRLRQYYESSGAAKRMVEVPGPAGDTNILNKARTALLTVTTNFPQSPVLGKCQLDLGWCYLFDMNPVESEKQFQAALERLPKSTDRAMAHFKLGDLQFRRGNDAGAVTNYEAVITESGNDPAVETNLFELALYQTVRSALAVTNFSAATNALQKLVAWYPESHHTDGSVLLTGQSISRESPAEASALYLDFLKRFPDAKLRPEIELAIARTYELQNDWKDAAQEYQGWLTRFTNHESRPHAEYCLGQALSKTGDQTNAFKVFVNFVVQYPTNDLTPLAQWCVAGFYFNNGAYAAAETNYQRIVTGWPKSDLAFQARLMAGRAAMGRTSYETAANYYFLPLCTNAACPPDIQAQAWFAYGDAVINQDSTNRIENYAQAILIYKKAAEATNGLNILAWGQIASCYLQYATNATQLTNAVDNFQKIIDEPKADVVARSIAKVGLAVVLRKQADEAPTAQQAAALRKKALDHCLDVFERKLLRPNETPDAFWTMKAGLEAAELAGTIDEWAIAARIYERLVELLPELRPTLEKKLLAAQKRATVAKTNSQ